MAMIVGAVGSCGAADSSAASRIGGGFLKGGGKGKKAGGRAGIPRRVGCSAASSTYISYTGHLRDQYRTLRIQPGVSETEVKQAFRRLALQYHPDVCKGSNCEVQFHQINEAYDMVMRSLRAAEEEEAESQRWGGAGEEGFVDDEMRGMCDQSWDLWEEWMGWEGAGIRDYTSHINPYI